MALAVPTSGTAANAATSGVVVRTITRGASLGTFPSVGRAGTVGRTSHDARSLGEGGAFNRSLSPRGASGATHAATRVGIKVPGVASTPIAGASGVTHSTEGLNVFDQRTANNGNQFTVTPPDGGLCAGNGKVIETVNDVIQVFDASLHPLTGVTDLNTFYGYPAQIDRTGNGGEGPFVTDPSCIYDAADNRFVVLVLTLEVNPESGNLLGPNHLDLAVSATGDPTKGWNIYRLPVQDDGTQGTPKHKNCPCIGDYPHIGQDANGIYVTTNEYPLSTDPGLFGNNYNGSQFYAFPKHALATSSSHVSVFSYGNLQVGGTPAFTPWPAQAAPGRYDSSNGGTEWFLQSNAAAEALGNGSANSLIVWSFTNTSALNSGHAPSLHAKAIASEQYVVPPLSTQKAGSTPLGRCITITPCGNDLVGASDQSQQLPGQIDSNDSRMQQTWYDGGMVWGALDTAVYVNGATRAGIAWFVVKVGASPAVMRQGYVANANNNLIYPAISVMPGGKGVMSASAVGTTLYPSSTFTRIDATGPHGPVNLVAAGPGPLDDFCAYTVFDCAGNGNPPIARPRFGDYNAVYPLGNTMVIETEYVGQTCSLETWVNDPTCGNTRVPLSNWSTRVATVTP